MKVRFQPRTETKRVYLVQASDDKSSRELNMEARNAGMLHHGYHLVIRSDGTVEEGRDKYVISSFSDKSAIYIRENLGVVCPVQLPNEIEVISIKEKDLA